MMSVVRIKRTHVVLAVAMAAFACTAAPAADGDLDPAFGTAGFARNAIPGGNGDRYPLAVDSAGNLVTCGATTAGSPYPDLLVARFLPRGVPDPTFGEGGLVRSDVAGNADICTAVAVQPDGKPVVAVQTFDAGLGRWRIAVQRRAHDGSIDPGFGAGTGTVVTDIGASGVPYPAAIAVQADGRIVVAGYGPHASDDYFALRLLADGSPDASFGIGGIAWIAFNLSGSQARDHASAMRIDSAQRIVIAGSVDAGSFQYDMGVARLLADGSLDPTFGDGGRSVIAFDRVPLGDDQALAMSLLADGGIALAGYVAEAVSPSNLDVAVARLLGDGSLDAGFGESGRVVVPIDEIPSGDDRARGIAELADGRLIVVGYAAAPGSGATIGVGLRLFANGSLDPSFGIDGIERYDFFPSNPPYGGQRLFDIVVDGPWWYASAWVISTSIPQEAVLIRLRGDEIFPDGFDAAEPAPQRQSPLATKAAQ